MFSELFLLEKIILFIKKLALILNTCELWLWSGFDTSINLTLHQGTIDYAILFTLKISKAINEDQILNLV